MAIGLLLIRLLFGVLMAAHGSQKLFGWFGGYGLSGTGTFFEQLGFRPGRLFAAAASLTEVLGGVLLGGIGRSDRTSVHGVGHDRCHGERELGAWAVRRDERDRSPAALCSQCRGPRLHRFGTVFA